MKAWVLLYNKYHYDMKQILVPTDFSKNAKNALEYGLALYENNACRFILLNVIPLPYTLPETAVFINDIYLQQCQQSFDKLLGEIRKKPFAKEVDFKIETETGNAVSVIAGILKSKKIDMVIMGTKGASGLTSVLMGSTTTSVIKKVKCPLLIIPEKSKFKAPRKIVLALDFKQSIAKKTLSPLLHIAKKYQSEVLLLQVIDNEDFEEKEVYKLEIKNYLKGVPHSFYTVHDRDIPYGIESFVKKQKASLIAMLSYRNTLFARLFHKSTTKKMALHTEIPILVLHHKRTV